MRRENVGRGCLLLPACLGSARSGCAARRGGSGLGRVSDADALGSQAARRARRGPAFVGAGAALFKDSVICPRTAYTIRGLRAAGTALLSARQAVLRLSAPAWLPRVARRCCPIWRRAQRRPQRRPPIPGKVIDWRQIIPPFPSGWDDGVFDPHPRPGAHLASSGGRQPDTSRAPHRTAPSPHPCCWGPSATSRVAARGGAPTGPGGLSQGGVEQRE